MADNVILNAPTTVGSTIATDDVGGIQHQLVKVEFGGDGVATPVTVAAPLPTTDAAAEASVSSIDTKTPALGQALAAASVPVVLTAAQITTLTPIAGNLEVTQLLVKAKTDNLDVLLSTRTKPADQQHTIVDSGTLTAVTAITNALPSGTNLLGKVGIDQVTANANEVVTKTGSTTVISAITSAAANAKVDVGLVNGEAVDVGAGTEAAAIRVTLPTDGTGKIATVSTVTAVTAISNALPAGTNLLGNVGIDQTTPGTTNAVSLKNAAGTAIGSQTIGTTVYSNSSVVQDVEVSSANSSTTPLAIGGVFTGTSASTLGVGAIQIAFFSDVNCEIQCQQSQDGTNWDIKDVYNYVANSTNISAGRTFVAEASFVRTVVTNLGGTSSVLRLQTILCPIADPLPRSLSALGNLRTMLNEAIPSGTNTIGNVVTASGTFTRLQEQQYLVALATSYGSMMTNERYSGNRGFEIR